MHSGKRSYAASNTDELTEQAVVWFTFKTMVFASKAVCSGLNASIEYIYSFIHIRLIEKVVRTQLNMRIQHKTGIR